MKEVRSLTKEQAEQRLPVALKGVITVVFKGRAAGFILNDGTSAVFVSRYEMENDNPSLDEPIRAKDIVEVKGVTITGGFSRDVVASSIRRVGVGKLPEALPVRMDDLLGGELDCQMVKVTGVIQSIERREKFPGQWFILRMKGERRLAVMIINEGQDAGRFIDAEVEITGVNTSFFNERAELIGVSVQAQDLSAIHILRPSVAGHLTPLVSLKDLMEPLEKHGTFGRIRTMGNVSFISPDGFFYIQDDDRAVKVTTRHPNHVSLGDRVEVIGYSEVERYFAELTGAEIIGKASGTVPGALHVTHTDVIKNWRPGYSRRSFDGKRVRMEARLEKIAIQSTDTATLYLSHEGNLISAALMNGGDLPGKIRPGAVLSLEGICVVELNKAWPADNWIYPTGFSLLVQSPADINVLKVPAWWTPERIWTAFGIAATLGSVATVWVMLLRQQVANQTKLIRKQTMNEAVAQERKRMAREFHDTLEQELAGLSIQLDSAADAVPASATFALSALEEAHTMLRYTRTETRRSIWDLRATALQKKGLFGAIEWSASQMRESGTPKIHLKCSGEVREIGPRLETHLLRISTECLANAVKHSGGSSVELELSYSPDHLELTILDDGQGFTVPAGNEIMAGHFGLRGIRERAKQIGAELTISSSPGNGTKITVMVTFSNLQES
ncbi:MAG: sensor histidine kinase [Akkermansiaceae bacterium]|nr:sensor histidine kinase [Akkermansiaceae bacterium]